MTGNKSESDKWILCIESIKKIDCDEEIYGCVTPSKNCIESTIKILEFLKNNGTKTPSMVDYEPDGGLNVFYEKRSILILNDGSFEFFNYGNYEDFKSFSKIEDAFYYVNNIKGL